MILALALTVLMPYGCVLAQDVEDHLKSSVIDAQADRPGMQNLRLGARMPTIAAEFEIYATGVQNEKGVSDVIFEIWRIASGDEGRKSYSGASTGDNDWKTLFQLSDFDNKPGTFKVSVYGVDQAGGSYIMGTRSFTVSGNASNTPIMGESQAAVEQMVSFFKSSGSAYPAYYEEEPRSTTLEDFARLYYESCQREGVRAEVAWAQMCLETGFLKYGNLVSKEQFNFAGLGATGPGEPGFDFSTAYGNDAHGILMGIVGHVQHLKCYASSDPVMMFIGDASDPENAKPVDPRWMDELRSTAPSVELLDGRWAASVDYAANLVNFTNGIISLSS